MCTSISFIAQAVLIAASTQQMSGLSGSLDGAEIRVVLYQTHAVVISHYLIERTDTPLVFEATRQRGQLVTTDEALGPGFSMETQHLVELRRLIARAAGAGPAEFRIRHTVEGELTRIPIFVPNAATPPGQVAIDITVLGDTDQINLKDTFPRLQRQPDGSLLATVSNVPSVLVLPSGGSFSVVRISEWIVVLLVVGATAYWAVRTFRRRSSNRA